ncbi:rRNA maturation RNase YbeY [Marivita hallyeonensis]|uniref:Endoribonuclease YbeY n=1 Tax=Marivita hallyeonensis TaxID=996342 RepID=A0A1M5X4W0_9RHOB|nr:rRNA maturation RNase YbeY [Marivita hallyeonensis]SHH94910.1 probable rRNA maturation factor [Marivita hallyeonensis]
MGAGPHDDTQLPPLTDILIEDDRWDAIDLSALAERAAVQTLEHLGHSARGYEIAVLGCDDARIADLNAEFREKPGPTNVLSWPARDLSAEVDGDDPTPPPPPDPLMGESLGDIAIAFDTCAREADAGGKSLADHTVHLLVHGVLHLLGYDHVRDRDATLMEGLETEILGKMGLADPYRE